MKTKFILICLFSGIFLVACKSNPEKTEPAAAQNSATVEQQSTNKPEETDGDRGFDPCKLNANLASCRKE